ncbi:MAG TPA: hypothetical protein VFV41_17385 [Streptosporangiaceae bacterium]|nr:hypothetical protein [Streptosporangiaceae bacterium]
MRRLTAAEFRKLVTIRLGLWILLASVAWAAGYTALALTYGSRAGGLTPPLTSAAGQHALFAIGAGGAGPLAAVLGAAAVAGEFRHRTAATTFLVTPRRGQVMGAQLITYLVAGIVLALACTAVSLAITLPWLHARGVAISLTGHGNLAVLGGIIVSAAVLGAAGAGLGALAGGQLTAVASLLIYLYVAEPVVSHITALNAWTPYLPGVAADGLTQAAQAGVRLLAPWLGGVVLAAWAAALAAAGTVRTLRRDLT